MRTRPSNSPARLPALAGAVLLAACGSERATEPAETFDPSLVLAEVTGQFDAAAGGLALVGGSPTLGALAIAAPRGPAAGGCAWRDADQAFVCEPRTLGGLTHTYQYVALDAGGGVLRAPTRATTAALRTAGTTRGTLTSTVGGRTTSVGIDQRHEATIRGLLTATRTVDATMTATYDAGGAAGGAGTTRFTTTQTTAGLVLPANGARWPSAGTITTVLGGGSGLGESRTVMTFNGTSVVAIEMTFGGTTERCTLDLAAPPSAAALRCS